MFARQNAVHSSSGEFSPSRPPLLVRRIWRYGPLVIWLALIFFGSTDALSASNTSGLTRKILLTIDPRMDEGQLVFWQFLIRKAGHFTEYAVLALLAVRSFAGSSLAFLRRRHILTTFLLIVGYALLDEYHQSFIPTRGPSIYDSMIDIAGGATALLSLTLVRSRLRRRRAKNLILSNPPTTKSDMSRVNEMHESRSVRK